MLDANDEIVWDNLTMADPTGELPPSLVKALCDPFDYAVGLRDGRVIRFAQARKVKGGEWITLHGLNEEDNIEMSSIEYNFPRGLDVRISDIMWTADAPEGS